MKKAMVSMMKKSGESVARVPVTVKSWPFSSHQPKMPASLREKMEKHDK